MNTIFSPALAAAPQALQLFTTEPLSTPPAEAALDHWTMLFWIAAGAALLVVSAAVSVMAWRGRWRDPPATRAADELSKSLNLRADARATLARLAQALGTEPVALLLSESAFEQGVAALESHGGPLNPRDKAAVLSLRAIVFGVHHAADTRHVSTEHADPERPPLNIAA